MVTRNPDLTRERLLDTAFWEIYRHGFQACRLEAILEQAGVTKGALYYHFKSKRELGLAVIDEVIRGWILSGWVKPLAAADHPVDGLKAIIHEMGDHCSDHAIELGCPLNNLVQEMSPIDETFRLKLDGILTEWRAAIAHALLQGQKVGQVRASVDPTGAAAFLVAAVEGIAGSVKNARSAELAQTLAAGLEDYLESLRLRHESAA